MGVNEVLWPPHVKSWLIGKDPDAGRAWGQEEKGMTEDEMAGWHHWLDGPEFEWTPGVGDGQGGLACCDSWGRKESDMTEQLNWTELNGMSVYPNSMNVCYCSVTKLCPTLCDPMHHSTPVFPACHQLPEFTQTHVHRVGDVIQTSHPLSSPSPTAFNLSQHQSLFKWVSYSHQVAKVLEFQLQHLSSNEYSGLISCRIEWFDLLAVQRTLKSLLQHHSSK